MAFTLKLYNLSSMWHNNIHTAAQVYKFKHAANNALKKLPVYTRIKHDHDTPKTSISGDTDWAADKAACNAAGWLEDSGYDVVPDVFEVNSNVWGLINKVHMETFFLHP